ncbi:hypothetical protein [Vibrio mediterranei]|uniref:hypothetical protein n=1 Tax=Vibrio mediterranei TaxID=689 RepID=UPI0040682707
MLKHEFLNEFHRLQSASKLVSITLFDNPLDFPNKAVLRVFEVVGANAVPTRLHLVADTAEELSDMMHSTTLAYFPRDPHDDPQIVGTWL